MLTIYLNDQAHTWPQPITLADFLTQHGYDHGHFAVALNRQFLPRVQHSHTLLQSGDTVDIITPMQGG